MIDKRLRRARRIFADDQGGGAMRIDVVGAILRVVFEDENGGVVPIRAVRNRIDDAAERQIVIGYRGLWRGLARRACLRVIVGQVEQGELRKLFGAFPSPFTNSSNSRRNSSARSWSG